MPRYRSNSFKASRNRLFFYLRYCLRRTPDGGFRTQPNF
jgi:hypothetical protein